MTLSIVILREFGYKYPKDANNPANILNMPAHFHFLSVFKIRIRPRNTPIISLIPENEMIELTLVILEQTHITAVKYIYLTLHLCYKGPTSVTPLERYPRHILSETIIVRRRK